MFGCTENAPGLRSLHPPRDTSASVLRVARFRLAPMPAFWADGPNWEVEEGRGTRHLPKRPTNIQWCKLKCGAGEAQIGEQKESTKKGKNHDVVDPPGRTLGLTLAKKEQGKEKTLGTVGKGKFMRRVVDCRNQVSNMANCTNLLVPPSFDSAPVTKPL